jgi:hypothetical protein
MTSYGERGRQAGWTHGGSTVGYFLIYLDPAWCRGYDQFTDPIRG